MSAPDSPRRQLAVTAALALVLAGGCGQKAPAESASSAPSVSAPAPAPEPAPADPVATPGEPVKKPRPAATRPKQGLMRNSGSAEGPISYLVVEPPKPAADTPLVIALHGRGDTADAFAGLAEALDQPTRSIVGRAPLMWGNVGGRAWYVLGAPDEAAQIRARVADLVTLAGQLRERYPEAPKPALYGFSQGAVVSLQAACDHPELWSAVVALSGRLATSDGCPDGSGELPILVVAGEKDRIIPAEQSWAAAETLTKLGRTVERFSFDGVHRVPREAVEALRAFIAKHVLKP